MDTFIKGSISGVCSAVVLQPFDVVKTRLQGFEQGILFKPTVRSAASEIMSADGLSGFWRGIVPTMIRASIGPSIYFSTLDYFQGNREHQDYKARVFLEGAFARGVAGFLLCPFTVVKTRFEWNKGAATLGTFRTLKLILKEEKFRGLFRGALPTLIRDVPSSGLYLVLYQSVFKPRAIEGQHESLHPVLHLVSASAAALLASIATQPFDCIRTQLQLSKQNLFQGVSTIYKQRGLAGFFAGSTLRLIRRPIAQGITWTVYEIIKK